MVAGREPSQVCEAISAWTAFPSFHGPRPDPKWEIHLKPIVHGRSEGPIEADASHASPARRELSVATRGRRHDHLEGLAARRYPSTRSLPPVDTTLATNRLEDGRTIGFSRDGARRRGYSSWAPATRRCRSTWCSRRRPCAWCSEAVSIPRWHRQSYGRPPRQRHPGRPRRRPPSSCDSFLDRGEQSIGRSDGDVRRSSRRRQRRWLRRHHGRRNII